MSRYVTNVSSGKPEGEIDAIILRVAESEGFKQKLYKGETVYKNGSGILAVAKYMLIRRSGTSVHIEAWIQNVTEQDLDGVVALVQKKQLKGKIDRLITALK